MKIRLAGLTLIAIGIVFAVLFVYLPVRDGPDGFIGRVRLNALVFVPLAVVTGAAFVIGGTPVLDAFQARPKSRAQMTLVLSIIIGSGVLTGLGYWQLKTRWMPPKVQEIIRERNFAPTLPAAERPQWNETPPVSAPVRP